MRWTIGHFKSASETGNWGEDLAATYLKKQGCKILDRNVKPRGRLELDIIAYLPKRKLFLFVEVKTRKFADDDHRPMMAVTLQKRKNMRKAGLAWLKKTNNQTFDPNYRFDVVEVIGQKESNVPPEIHWVQGISMEGVRSPGAYW